MVFDDIIPSFLSIILVGLGLYEGYLFYRLIIDKPRDPLKIFTGIVFVSILILLIYMEFSPSYPVNFINRLTIVGIVIALLAFLLAVRQEDKNNQKLEEILTKIKDLNSPNSELNQQNQSPEGDMGKIIPSELHDDGDTKTITTQYESDNVIVTSTIKITIRKE